jgi:hypothetical protein
VEIKTIYPTWINEFGYGFPVTIVNNPDGTVTVKDDNSPRQSTGNDLAAALSKLQQDTENARLTGDL